MKPDELRTGLVVRVVAAGLGAPLGSLATIKSIGTTPTGGVCVRIRYHERRQGKRLHMYRSSLFESDLSRIEIVTDEKAGRSVSRSRSRKDQERSSRIQLSLPFPQDDDNYISGSPLR